MALNFPNASRSYDAARHCVSFWGHEAMSEIAFHVDEEALKLISPSMQNGEESVLRAFDANRSQIEQVAGAAHSRRRQNYHRLSASEF